MLISIHRKGYKIQEISVNMKERTGRAPVDNPVKIYLLYVESINLNSNARKLSRGNIK